MKSIFAVEDLENNFVADIESKYVRSKSHCKILYVKFQDHFVLSDMQIKKEQALMCITCF